MKSVVRSWGNGLGVLIHRTLALAVSIMAGSKVSLAVRDGEIVITPVRPGQPSLRQLLSKVTSANLHSAMATGDAKGGEAW